MKLKKILAGAMAGAMVLGSVVGVSAAQISSTTTYEDGQEGQTIDGSSGWNTTDGDDFLLSGNQVTVVFENTPFVRDEYFWSQFIIETTASDDAAGITLRADAWGWTFGDNTSNIPTATVSLSTSDNTYDYQSTEKDFVLDTSLSTENTTITVIASCTTQNTVVFEIIWGDNVTTETYTVTYPEGVPDELYFHVGSDGGIVKVLSATYNTGISIADMKVLAGGNPIAIDVTYTPAVLSSQSISYESDNEYVTITDGAVSVSEEAEEGDTATITAICGDYTTTFKVEVTKTENPIVSVTASSTEVSVAEGSSVTVTAEYTAQDTTSATTDSTVATWVSADETIATVNNGVITGVAAGETTVTVTIGSVSATIDVTVTEAASETAAVTDDTDTEDATTEEETETEETVTTVEESETMEITDFWTTFTSGYEVTEDVLTLTLTTTNNGSSNWENVIWVLYSSDSGYLCSSGADSDAAAADNYIEYYVGRADAYGWDGASAVGTATLEATYSDDFDWDTWLAATQAGAEVTITAVLDGDGNAIVTLECEGMSYSVTIPVDSDSTIYLALTGENCTLSDLTVNGESANFPVLVQTAVTEDTETTETETESESSTTTVTVSETQSGSSTGDANTGDASPIIPIAVAMLGCAAVVIAGKKRMA